MRTALIACSLFLLSTAVHAKPPREESPVPRANLEGAGSGNSDEALAEAIAAAEAHPLGTLANPIRVAGPEGARAYLASLRCADGSIPRIGPMSGGGVDTYGSVASVYPVSCGTAPAANLVVDIYQEEHVETRAPDGFRVAR